MPFAHDRCLDYSCHVARPAPDFFKVLLDEANYPLVFHCIAGQDRTGSVAFILNALLGVEIEELYLDWEISGFWNPDVNFSHEKYFDRLIAAFESLPGADMQEKVEGYVLDLGFSPAEIEKFRSMMLQE